MENAHLRRKSIPHPDYLFKTTTHWRMRAEKMRTLAEEANDSTVRAMMLRIAADYDRLAESADDRAAHDSIMFRTAEVPPESRPDAHLAPSGNASIGPVKGAAHTRNKRAAPKPPPPQPA
jgi:hypothetical protein